MSVAFYNDQAQHDFNKARWKELINRILTITRPGRGDLLSLEEIKEALKPKSETYRGMQQVPVEKIVGSEGRYRDFNKRYLPRYEYLRQRWMNIDLAHLKSVILPPISLYEIGGLYFVRDGNHRVSVARMKGVLFIDAEVVSLNSEIRLDSNITRDTLTEKVIEWEQKRFFKKTGFDRIFPPKELVFTAPGRYDEIYGHILVHKFYINQNRKGEISFHDAMISWYNNVFKPIIETIEDNRVMLRFPGRTPADLYVWTSRHWDALKQKYGADYTMTDAVRDYSMIYGKGLWAQLQDFLFTLYSWLAGKEKI
jgi:hypothetical protein